MHNAHKLAPIQVSNTQIESKSVNKTYSAAHDGPCKAGAAQAGPGKVDGGECATGKRRAGKERARECAGRDLRPGKAGALQKRMRVCLYGKTVQFICGSGQVTGMANNE
jgi:hypothetical protein